MNMNNPHVQRRVEELRVATRAAVERYEATQRRLEAAVNKPIEPGDMFIIPPTPEGVCMFWLVVREHVDSADDFFCVPTDTADLWMGCCDIPDRGPDPQMARCGLGIWLSKKFLQENASRVDLGYEQWANDCRRMLAGMVRGEFHTDPECESHEADPDYQDHMQEVRANMEAIQKLHDSLVP